MERRRVKEIWGLFLPRIKILAYHAVDLGCSDPYGVDVFDFEAQMTFLSENKYNVISLEEACWSFQTNNIKKKSVVITFDDGFKCLHRSAFPVLYRYNFPATVFLPVSFVGDIDRFSYAYPRPDYEILSWDEITKAMDIGISFGSHSMTHPNLAILKRDELNYELCKSKQIIEDKLNPSFFPFAYPFGLYNDQVRELCGELGYNCALCFGNVVGNSKLVDMFALKREKVLNSTSIEEFKLLVNTRFDLLRKTKKTIENVKKINI